MQRDITVNDSNDNVYFLKLRFLFLYFIFVCLFFFSSFCFQRVDVVDLRTAFILMDSDNDGRVTALEIQNMLSSLGIVLREEVVVNLVRQASQSGWLFSLPLDLK